MNRFVLHIILFFLSHFSYGQGLNLVYNGSFEEYSECPASNELNDGQFERATGWWKPTDGTPDFFHRCNNASSGVVGVPNNFWGHQEAYHGDGYVGIVPIEWNVDGKYVGNEYIRTQLTYPLKPCVEYRFSMFVSLANYSTHGIRNIGAWFSIENQYLGIWTSLMEVPQIVYNNSPITDTTNWTKIEGTFVAKGFEKFLTIGYFRNNVNMDTLFIQDWGFGSAPYYYIDSVSLYEIGTVPSELCSFNQIEFLNIFTPNNDGINDLIDISMYLGIVEEVQILNRWGNVITVLNKDNPIWNGENCTEGVYYYFFEYDMHNIKQKQSGLIHLVR